jgi:hypothetical protein
LKTLALVSSGGGDSFVRTELQAKAHEFTVVVSDVRARGFLIIMSGVLSGHRGSVVVEKALNHSSREPL